MTNADGMPVVRKIPRAVAAVRVSALSEGSVRGRMIWRVDRANKLVGPFMAYGEPYLVADPLGLDVPQLFVALVDVASYFAHEFSGVDVGGVVVANASHCVTLDL